MSFPPGKRRTEVPSAASHSRRPATVVGEAGAVNGSLHY